MKIVHFLRGKLKFEKKEKKKVWQSSIQYTKEISVSLNFK